MEKENLLILVIDPDKRDHSLIQESLARSKVPAHLRFATSTDQALKVLQKGTFDLILTDHALPRANAFHLLFELQCTHRNLPVIIVTRDSGATVAREAFQRGVDDYILKEEIESISLFDVIGNAIERRHQRDEKIEREMRLQEQAERDGLTGLYNHRYFVDALERETARAKRYRRHLALLMIDLDGFKLINDTCGHPQGDQVLRQVARLLLQTVRFVDIVARYGGDEFSILLPETNSKGATKIAMRVLREVRNAPFLYENRIFPLSVSIGGSVYNQSQSAGTLLRETDQALYKAKRGGRDRLVFWDNSEPKGGGREQNSKVPGGPSRSRDDVK